MCYSDRSIWTWATFVYQKHSLLCILQLKMFIAKTKLLIDRCLFILCHDPKIVHDNTLAKTMGPNLKRHTAATIL